MFDYRLFFPKASIDSEWRVRPTSGSPTARVFRLECGRRNGRRRGCR